MSLPAFPKRVLKRYAELVLRFIYQHGGRDRFIAVAAIEEALGLEEDLVLRLCRTRLRGEVLVAYRPPQALEEALAFEGPLESHLYRRIFTEPHVRIRPRVVRLTEAELVPAPRKRKRRRKRRSC